MVFNLMWEGITIDFKSLVLPEIQHQDGRCGTTSWWNFQDFHEVVQKFQDLWEEHHLELSKPAVFWILTSSATKSELVEYYILGARVSTYLVGGLEHFYFSIYWEE